MYKNDTTFICYECNRLLKPQGVSVHLNRTHKISAKNYFDKYFIGPINKCIYCNKPTNFESIKAGYNKFCSQNCARKYILNETKKKYNVENISQIDSARKKISIGNKQNWHNLSNEDYNSRCLSISEGTKYHMTKAIDNLNIDIYNYCQKYNLTSIRELIKIYGTGFLQSNLLNIQYIKYKHRLFIKNNDIHYIAYYNNLNVRSKAETILYNLVKLYYPEAVQNKKILGNQELDIYIPSINLAIEYNGNYWHSFEHNNDISYHLHKSLKCREKGIRLIHIYEFEDFQDEIYKLICLLEQNIDIYGINYNKNNLLDIDVKPEIIYKDKYYTIYGAGSNN